MFDERVSLGDIRTFFQHTVCLVEERPALVKKIGDNKMASVLYLLTQKEDLVPFSFGKFKPPLRRLGNVNTPWGVIYVSRRPMRVFQMGLTKESCRFSQINSKHSLDVYAAMHHASQMDNVQFGMMMYGKYPSFREAFKNAKGGMGVVAFDRQFAVDAAGRIYYRHEWVGDIARGRTTIESIVFKEQFQHLRISLGNNYEKDLANYGI